MTEKMRAAYLLEKGKFEFREIEKPEPGDEEILIRVKHVGVCGADVEFFGDGACGGWVVDAPMILGHEPSGEVAGFGKNVTGFEVGDKVVVEPGEPCWDCEYCRSGHYNLCPDVQFKGVPGYDGAFREYMTANANLVYKLPEGVGTLEGALVEPLAVGFNAVAQSEAKIGQSATILGSGCIGLMVLLALRAQGIREIYVVDAIAKRLEKAKELGASEVIDITKENAADAVARLTGGAGTDLVYEVTGNDKATLQTVELAKKGGVITLIGLSTAASMPFNVNGVIGKELTIRSNFRYRNQFPIVLGAIKDGLVDLKGVISDVFSFDEVQAGLERNTHQKADVIKEVIEF
ncbi:sorbitol dehydrogenase [Clostridia bacterium]|nr:sorbitol dehydrogenase [Clostridia bacterium]